MQCGRQINVQPYSSDHQNTQQSYTGLQSSIPKDWTVALLLSYFLGGFGIDRFYLGHTGLGVIKLLTCGGCGIWALIDFLIIGFGSMRDSRGMPLAGREGKEWIFYILIVLSLLFFFAGFCSALLGL